MACACEKEQLLRKIQLCDFALTEVSLYLDTHPTCPHGLSYYQKHKLMRDEYAALYTEKFGPLNIRENLCPNRWAWVENPWPWELEA